MTRLRLAPLALIAALAGAPAAAASLEGAAPDTGAVRSLASPALQSFT